MKYSLPGPAARYSHAPDYPEVARAAIKEMFQEVGPYRLGEDGLLKSGVLIRHLVLPENLENSYGVLEWIADTFRPGEVLVSLMSQYVPPLERADLPEELRRRLKPLEYKLVLRRAEKLGITIGDIITLKDYEAYLKACIDNDMAGNGNTIGLTDDPGNLCNLFMLFSGVDYDAFRKGEDSPLEVK